MERFTIGLEFSGQPFEFELWTRQVQLGRAGMVDYYWMDRRGLVAGNRNFRACVDSWWACMRSHGGAAPRDGQSGVDWEQVEANERGLVLAELYPLVSKSKNQQGVFLDAHLRPKPRARERNRDSSEPEDYALDSEEARRLMSLADTRDVEAIRTEIRDLLAGELPPDDELQALWTEFCRRMSAGMDALRRGGQNGLRAFIDKEFAPWLERSRKRGDTPRPARRLLDLITYNAKVSFYTSYANAWIGLIPVLRERRGLDARGAQWLRLWHNQNPPDSGADVFWRQVLALHPISAVMMTGPDHRSLIGAYLLSVEDTANDDRIANKNKPAYWRLVGSILIAGHEYKRMRERAELQRARRPVPEQAAGDSSPHSEEDPFNEYARRELLNCSSCGSYDLHYVSHDVISREEQELKVTYHCAGCGQDTPLVVAAADLLDDGQ